MPLLVVQSFVNTYEADTGVDLLGDLAGVCRGSRTRGFWTAGFDARAPIWSRPARCVRACGRCWSTTPAATHRLAQLEPLGRPGRSVATSASCGRRWPRRPRGRVGATSIRLADLLLIVRDAQRDGSWKRLKACRNDECLWAFYDRSHAGRGAWCDMASCGNRIKNRNLRARRSSLARDDPQHGRAATHLCRTRGSPSCGRRW